MVATVQVREWNGNIATPTQTDKTGGTVRFKNADNAAVDNSNPMRIQSGVTDYSFEKWLRLYVSGGTYNQITNCRFYTDGGNGLGTGVGLYVKTAASYATPVEPASTTGFSSAFGYTSAAPLSLGAGPYTANPGNVGDFLVALMTVGDTAQQGQSPAETLTFSYDES